MKKEVTPFDNMCRLIRNSEIKIKTVEDYDELYRKVKTKENHDHFIDAMRYMMVSRGYKPIPWWKLIWFKIKRRFRSLKRTLTTNNN